MVTVIDQHLLQAVQIPADAFRHPFMAVRLEPEGAVSPAFQGAVDTGISDFHLISRRRGIRKSFYPVSENLSIPMLSFVSELNPVADLHEKTPGHVIEFPVLDFGFPAPVRGVPEELFMERSVADMKHGAGHELI